MTFDELRGLVTTTTGWSAQTFDETPMSVVLGLVKYWGDNPPVHVIEAAKAGLGKRKQRGHWENEKEIKRPREMTEEEKRAEALLPKWVQDIRAKQREERKEKWLATMK